MSGAVVLEYNVYVCTTSMHLIACNRDNFKHTIHGRSVFIGIMKFGRIRHSCQLVNDTMSRTTGREVTGLENFSGPLFSATPVGKGKATLLTKSERRRPKPLYGKSTECTENILPGTHELWLIHSTQVLAYTGSVESLTVSWAKVQRRRTAIWTSTG